MKTHFLKSLVLFSVIGLTTSCERQENDVNLQEISAEETKAEAFEINPETGKRMYNVQTFNLGNESNIINNRSGKGAGLLYKNQNFDSDWKDLSRSTLEDMEDETGQKSFTNLDGLQNRFTFIGSFNKRPKSIFINDIRFGKKSSVNKKFKASEREIKFMSDGKISEVLNVDNGPFTKAHRAIFSEKNDSNQSKSLSTDGEWNFSETETVSLAVKKGIKSEFEAGGKLFKKLDLKVKFSYEQSTTNTNSTSTSRGFKITTKNKTVNTPPGKTAYWSVERRIRTENYTWKGKFNFTGRVIGDFGRNGRRGQQYSSVDANSFFYEYADRGDMEIPTSLDYHEYRIKTWYE